MTAHIVPIRQVSLVDLPCDVKPSPEAAGPMPSAPAMDRGKPARECAGPPPRQIASTAQVEAGFRAYWLHQQLKLMELAEEGGRQEAEAMCKRILERRAAGISDPVEHKPNDATWDYQTERDAGWDWR